MSNYKNNSSNSIIPSSNNTPFIFAKKVSDNPKIIPLSDISNTLGPARYFPSATKEWFNSVYAYNSNYIKNLPIVDKNLTILIKSYFNLFLKKKYLNFKPMTVRFKRLSLNNILVSRAELKHTSNKVIITLYVYNEEKRLLLKKIKRLELLLFSDFKLSSKTIKNRPLSIQNKLFFLEKQILYLAKESNNINYNNPLHIDLIKETLEKEIMAIAYYKLLLSLNKAKFEDKFIENLKTFVSKLYNKEVEFNIVNLKTLYFNSDIFTQAIATKIKNRKNKLLRVLKSSLYLVKLPRINKIREKYGKDNRELLWLNKVKNLKVNINTFKVNKDKLSNLLFDVLPLEQDKIKTLPMGIESLDNKCNSKIENFVLNSLKHKAMAGARLEAKGRLTKRFTASRSVFKIKWKGSLKNIESSYKGLSSVILRGHFKSNLQYSTINSKTRNGAFGLKGWISSK